MAFIQDPANRKICGNLENVWEFGKYGEFGKWGKCASLQVCQKAQCVSHRTRIEYTINRITKYCCSYKVYLK